ncbi:MAG: hypothetical protein WCI71_06200 [Bacteroidota bacterium]
MATVTLNVKNLRSNTDLQIGGILLDQHSLVDVMVMIVHLYPKQKPPAGTIWLMRPAGWQPGDTVIDQFATFKLNNLTQASHLELYEVSKQ